MLRHTGPNPAVLPENHHLVRVDAHLVALQAPDGLTCRCFDDDGFYDSARHLPPIQR